MAIIDQAVNKQMHDIYQSHTAKMPSKQKNCKMAVAAGVVLREIKK